MHVVLKRRGITLRAVWDGISKPTVHQAKHWARVTPSATQLNNAFISKGNVALITDDHISREHTVTAVTANLITVNMTSSAQGKYDLSLEDQAISADTTRTSYSGRFIVGLLGQVADYFPSTTVPSRTLERTLRLSASVLNDTPTAVAIAIEKVNILYFNKSSAQLNVASLRTSAEAVTCLRMSHAGISDRQSSLSTHNEYADDVYVLKATLPDKPLIEEDDPQQYTSLPETDDDVLSAKLSEESTVTDFFKAARVAPTMRYEGRLLNGGDGQSRRVGKPTIRVTSDLSKIQFIGDGHDRLLVVTK